MNFEPVLIHNLFQVPHLGEDMMHAPSARRTLLLPDRRTQTSRLLRRISKKRRPDQEMKL